MIRRAAGVCAVLAMACSPPPAAENGPAARDTLRGVVAITGSEPMTVLVLQTAGGPAALCGDRELLARVAGLEVAVWGRRDGQGRFCVWKLAVRAANGVAAADGTLTRAGQGYALVTDDGRRLPVARLPEALRPHVGARVWLAGPLDRAPDSFGLISGPR